MSSGERPIGAAKGTQYNTEALCQPPPPPHRKAQRAGADRVPREGHEPTQSGQRNVRWADLKATFSGGFGWNCVSGDRRAWVCGGVPGVTRTPAPGGRVCVAYPPSVLWCGCAPGEAVPRDVPRALCARGRGTTSNIIALGYATRTTPNKKGGGMASTPAPEPTASLRGDDMQYNVHPPKRGRRPRPPNRAQARGSCLTLYEIIIVPCKLIPRWIF